MRSKQKKNRREHIPEKKILEKIGYSIVFISFLNRDWCYKVLYVYQNNCLFMLGVNDKRGESIGRNVGLNIRYMKDDQIKKLGLILKSSSTGC